MRNKKLFHLTFALMLAANITSISQAAPLGDMDAGETGSEPVKAMDKAPAPEMSQISDPKAQGQDLIDTALQAGSFQTLSRALKAAGLLDTLKAPGPFTLFAPTDEAFAALPPKTLESLLKPENKEKLIKILTYHVVPGTVQAKDVAELKETKTLEGQPLKISHQKDEIRINNARLVKTDIVANNGIIHGIDKVLMPN